MVEVEAAVQGRVWPRDGGDEKTNQCHPAVGIIPFGEVTAEVSHMCRIRCRWAGGRPGWFWL